ncbi:hypothetical protein [Marinobacter salsuginis]|jgi:hypothetical protein|uniref:Uncharacterized protein n=1 Tax=Marinobacter salsuginis TaxID=418719 RepID=A0A5M3Q0W6_9GAMM|nr:hypothetical protein [Marinobacter salsuginis]GBO88732.1 hypothetical protein MSSD14B_24000 [Marinobacter salsuginis]
MMTLTLKNTKSPLTNMLVRIVEKGDGYGQYNRKTGEHALTNEKSEPLVEFYDLDNDHGPFGQFVSRYKMKTLLEREEGGICLDGGEPKWNVNANEMNEVRRFLRAAREQLTADLA